MSLREVAAIMGVRSTEVDELLDGEVPPSVAQRLSTRSSGIHDFIEGKVGIEMAQALGIPTSAAQELRDYIGRRGAIGVIIGICLGMGRGSHTPR